MENKSLTSFDIKSLYTNVFIKKMYQTFWNSLQEKKRLPIDKMIKIYTLCTKHCFFLYNSNFMKKSFLSFFALNGISTFVGYLMPNPIS